MLELETEEVPDIEGAYILRLPVYRDHRGAFCELHKDGWFQSLMGKQVKQTNLSISYGGVIRGLHYHLKGQDDLFCPIKGRINVVLFDRREQSPTYENTWSYQVHASPRHDFIEAIYVPGEVAHGFEALSQEVFFIYHVTEEYNPDDENEFPWDDPRVKHLWCTKNPILSDRDKATA